MSGETKRHSLALDLALVLGFSLAMEFIVIPLWHGAPAIVQSGILWTAGVAAAALLIVLIRATLRD